MTAAGTLVGAAPFEAELESALAGLASAGLGALRAEAAERFRTLGFPTLRDEEWRFTNVAPVAKTRFVAARGAVPEAAALEPHRLEGTVERVFVDGRPAPELARGALPAGIEVESLAEALRREPEALLPHLGRKATFDRQPFLALSTALFADGALVRVARGAVVAQPIHLIFYSTGGGAPTASFPRTLVLAGEGSQSTLVESFAGAPGAVYLTCPVTELVAAPAAHVDHYKLQRESRAAFHLSGIAVETARAANVSTHSFSLGGAIVRHDVRCALVGEGSEAILNGLYLVEDRQVADTHMRVDHLAPHCASHELYKGVLDGRARAVFSGRIHVHPGAQKTDAKQTNRNLLLSEDAIANSHPQLEIYADDVRCTHGSTVGQLDDEAVFYLRSRGIGLEAARSLLTYAFAADLVERVKVPALHRELQEHLFAWVPQGEVVRDAV
jgi:Fe-S cluster assembly protein SufD